MEFGRTSARRVFRTERHIDSQGVQISALHRSSATSAELDQEKGTKEKSKNSLLYGRGFLEASGIGDQVWFTDSFSRCR